MAAPLPIKHEKSSRAAKKFGISTAMYYEMLSRASVLKLIGNMIREKAMYLNLYPRFLITFSIYFRDRNFG
jgi:hypothetical protein